MITTPPRALTDLIFSLCARGATYLQKENFRTTFHERNDTPTERFTLNWRGHNIQIIRYDLDNHGLLACVDDKAGIMPVEEIQEFIEHNLREC